MKKYWVKISTRIDAMTLRDRALLFGLAAGFVIFVMFFFGLNPSYQKQRMMLDSMAQQQDRIAGVDAEITATIEAHTIDPDAAERARAWPRCAPMHRRSPPRSPRCRMAWWRRSA